MSLDYNLGKIEDWENVCFIERDALPSEAPRADENGKIREMAALTHAMIFATISVKLGQITEKNANEFYARMKILERLWGPFVYKMENGEKSDVELTPEDIRAHIGLSTNVIDESRAQFMKAVKNEMDRHAVGYTRDTEKAKETA